MADKAQRSTHAAVTLNKGQIIKKSDLIYKRPGYGIKPYLSNKIMERK